MYTLFAVTYNHLTLSDNDNYNNNIKCGQGVFSLDILDYSFYHPWKRWQYCFMHRH